MNALLRAIVIGSAFTAFLPFTVIAFTSPGAPTGYISDFAQVLTPSTESELNSELKAFDASTSIQISVATVPSLNGEDVDTYGNELFRAWGIGQKNSNNGVLLLVAVSERKVRLEVGYGLEGVLTDLQSGYIIDNIVTPSLKKNDFDTGVRDGVTAIEHVVQGEKFDTSKAKPGHAFDPMVLLFFGFMSISYMGSILARSKSWWLGGVLGAVGGGVVGDLFAGLIGMGIGVVILGLVGLLFDYFVSRTYRSHTAAGLGHPWFIGGGSSNGGGGGFGGFGGGSSGGGGASGSF